MTAPMSFDSLALVWRVYDEAAASIVKADTKAGFAAAVQGVLFAAAASLGLGEGNEWPEAAHALLWIGAAVIMTALLLAVRTVMPVLTKHPVRGTTEFLYFGALRTMDATQLAERLDGLSTEDTVRHVARQAITLGAIAWDKHKLLATSMRFTVVGAVVSLAGLLIAGGAR